MNSLITDLSQIQSKNSGRIRGEYEQISTTRDVTGDNFSNGNINFKWENSGLKHWDPSKTYIRTRLRFTKGDGTPIDTAFNVAPNMGLMGNMFYAADFKINDKPISKIGSYLPQVDALEKRLTKSKSWLNTIGAATNWWQASQSLRQAEISNDGRVVKDTVGVLPVDTVSTRVSMAFDAAGGGGAGERNSWAYTAATGVLVYARGTDAAGLTAANASLAFPVGSYFKYVGVANTPEVEMKVLTNDGGGNLVVEPNLNADVAADGRFNFSRVVKNDIQASVSRRIGEFETTWTPPLSIFKVNQALPMGKYELSLTPNSKTIFMKRAIESVLGQVSKDQQNPGAPVVAANIKVEVIDMYLYVYTFEGSRIDDITYYLDLENTRCQADKVNSVSFQNKNFEVSPSTFALTVAYQDLRVGEHTAISSSKFKSYEDAGVPTVQQELNLRRFYLNYAGQNMPAPDADPSFIAGTDYTTQRYVETQLNSGSYFDTGGAESIEDFHNRGSYYYFPIYRDGTDRSTRCTVNQEFLTGTNIANMQVMLFEHYRSLASVQIRDSRVVSVYTEDE